jgi:hypothetical protein
MAVRAHAEEHAIEPRRPARLAEHAAELGLVVARGGIEVASLALDAVDAATIYASRLEHGLHRHAVV